MASLEASPCPSRQLWVVRLGRRPYPEVWELQRRLHSARRESAIPDLLLLTEHDPVFTQGKHGDRGNLLVSAEVLRKSGVPCLATDRGGDITFHGPGQLVGYPILRLPGGSRSVKAYVETLEQVIVSALARFGIGGSRWPGNPGVWAAGAKIAAIGLAVSEGVSYHGFALNVDLDLTPFSWIRPCGLRNTSVTSMSLLLGRRVRLSEVEDVLAGIFSCEMGFAAVPFDPERLLPDGA